MAQCLSLTRLVFQAIIVAGLVLIGTNLAPPPMLAPPQRSGTIAVVRSGNSCEGSDASRTAWETALLTRVAALEARLADINSADAVEGGTLQVQNLTHLMTPAPLPATSPPLPPQPNLPSVAPAAPTLQASPAIGPFQNVALVLFFTYPDNLANLPLLRRWYAPFFLRVEAFCDLPASQNEAQAAAAAIAAGVPAEVVADVKFVHSGIGLSLEEPEFGGGGFSQVRFHTQRNQICSAHLIFTTIVFMLCFLQIILAKYIRRMRDAGELADSGSGPGGFFFLMDDVLMSPVQLARMSSAELLAGYALEEGRPVDRVGMGRDSPWVRGTMRPQYLAGMAPHQEHFPPCALC